MKRYKIYVAFILSITLSNLWSQQVIPDVMLNPANEDNYSFGIGVYE